MGIRCVRLEGSMAMDMRERMIDKFTHDPNVRVFLMSLKAGGVALNLTAARCDPGVRAGHGRSRSGGDRGVSRWCCGGVRPGSTVWSGAGWWTAVRPPYRATSPPADTPRPAHRPGSPGVAT